MRQKAVTGSIIGGLILCGAVAGYLFFRPLPSAAPVASHPVPQTVTGRQVEWTAPGLEALTSGPASNIKDTDAAATVEAAFAREMFVSELYDLYGDAIDHPRVQLQAIQRLIHYLKKQYPENWQDHIREYLSLAFPDLTDKLYDQFLVLEEFKQWMRDNYHVLMSMPADERREYLWARRKLFFGEQAEVIWESEMKAVDMGKALAEIDRQQNAGFYKKTQYYISCIKDIYGLQADAYQQHDQQTLMDQFLSVASVQTDLKTMTQEQRRKSLRQFRKSMGLDETAIRRWDELDAIRDRRWQNGRAYMDKRYRIVEQYTGEARKQQLDALRREFFDSTTADTIRNEESEGFFRFDRERIYGKN